MKKLAVLIFLVVLSGSVFSQSEKAYNTIVGFAPKYIGQEIAIYGIQDYLTMKEVLIAESSVGADSSFTFRFPNDHTQKVIVRSGNNRGFMYVQPGASYQIYFPERNRYDEYRPLGNDVELAFLDLPKEDINYKILSFDKWSANFLGEYFYRKNLNGVEFVRQLDTFKVNVEKAYDRDTSFFFKTYVKFSMAILDNIQHLGRRSRFEKFDFYLKSYPVAYNNPIYMDYLNSYFEDLDDLVSMEVGNRIYLGVLKNSPSLIMNAVNHQPSMKRLRLREYAIIKHLGDEYKSREYPQTNVMAVLDSLSKHAYYPESRLIAGNLMSKLTEIQVGVKAPEFSLHQGDSMISNRHFHGKHLYIQFLEPNMFENQKEIEVLIPLAEKYKSYVEVITVYSKPTKNVDQWEQLLQKIPWRKYEVEASNPIFKDYEVLSYPKYVLLDHHGYVVSSPALRPTPNGQYETIDKSFFYIGKLIDAERKMKE
ncbi:MAG: hypothetical protein EP338_01815 [Bacteroidetes bacterium]|nr:MAG: hypothetical protein EP338_01815 [Bacteroidota bacterium]